MNDLPPQIIMSNVQYHKLGHTYSFANKIGKICEGIPKSVVIDINEYDKSIIYVVEYNGEFLNIDHFTNREL